MSADFQLVSESATPAAGRAPAERDAAHRTAIELRRELSAARAELNQLRDQLEESRHLHAAADDALLAARSEILATRKVVAKMQATASWKLTAPLREIDSLMWRALRAVRGGKRR